MLGWNLYYREMVDWITIPNKQKHSKKDRGCSGKNIPLKPTYVPKRRIRIVKK